MKRSDIHRLLTLMAYGLGFALLEYALYVNIDRQMALRASVYEITQPRLNGFFQTVTTLGKSVWYVWPCGLATLLCAFLVRGKDVPYSYRRLAAYIGVRCAFVFAALALSGIVADLIKPLVGRARPPLWLHDGFYGFAPGHFDARWQSLPSGHTTTAFALAASLTAFYPRGRPVWYAFALLIAASRVMVDAHYVSDTVAGAVLGWLTVRAALRSQHLSRLWRLLFPIDGNGKV